MHIVDWIVLFVILLLIVAYGIWKTKEVKNSDSYFVGNRDLKWWTIGLSVMATQASAITFLSTPGQAFDDGMRFAQFYIGLPIAMVIICIFILPRYYKTHVVTAYEFLEKRFDLKTRTLTSLLFLIQRGLAAGLTIFAPSIILSTILGWNLNITTIVIGVLVIAYTVSGGAVAVSQTQKQQMIIILCGMFVAYMVIVFKLPAGVEVSDAMNVAGSMGKLNVIDWDFDLTSKYNVWTGIFGGTFLFLSYFGTDQSQVQRYLSGKSLTESRLGLLFNGIFKVPMQMSILFVGIMVFMFYQFNRAPLHFNTANVEAMEQSIFADEYKSLSNQLVQVQEQKEKAIYTLIDVIDSNQDRAFAQNKVNGLLQEERQLRDDARTLMDTYSETSDKVLVTEDTDYVFITFIINNLPRGLIGLLLAVILAAAMSSTSAELNALATCFTVDIYKRHYRKEEEDQHYLRVAKFSTAMWGVIALIFASFASLFDNLIEAVNIIGSLFYGVILGVFMVAFFVKYIRGHAIFYSALISEAVILYLFYLKETEVIDLPYLWLNAIGCLLVMLIAIILQPILKPTN